MSKDVNKRIGKFCRVCDNELYETDTKPYSRKLGDLSVFVGYAHNWNNDNVCHGCITEAVVRGEILEKRCLKIVS